MTTDILVIGAGPAGMAAAVAAAASGREVTVLDDNPASGGQIWRGGSRKAPSPIARNWFRRFAQLPITTVLGAQVISGDASNRTIVAERLSSVEEIRFDSLILATGARELFLPFPGWTLPGVMGLGGIQALAKSGMPIAEKSVVLAGTGPLLLAVAAYFQKHGAKVTLIAEQADFGNIVRFGKSLWRHPSKIREAVALRSSLTGVPYRLGCWIEEARGRDRLESVRLRQRNRVWQLESDFAGIGYGLVPNSELAALLGCEITARCIAVNEFQQTSIDRVFAAGECTGIGGVDSALVQGRIAGYSAAGKSDQARALFRSRVHAARFAMHLNEAFRLRSELKGLPEVDTIVCRCEDIAYGRLKDFHSSRAAKLHTRCGMGPCGGRVCGSATEFLFGWSPDSVRPPILPARVASLIEQRITPEEAVTK
ncbi:MAG: NAD(P)/FAD-dependent oxidoreductase [Acidobacteriaceae bacterium]|nr:NAD(P)/FAD-dependent oxidoreductase [Acidobacteriaceae bacterium]